MKSSYPTLDPELTPVAEALPPLDLADLESARAALAVLAEIAAQRVDWRGVRLETTEAAGVEHGQPAVPLRVFAPDERPAADLPVLVWIHGGGYVTGSAAVDDRFCTEVVRALGIVVVSADYRLAPETPFPGPVLDCYAALRHVRHHAYDLGVDPGRIAVGGQSAGGGLAAATVQLAVERGEVPVRFQVLDIPMLDDRLTTSSVRAFTDTPMWDGVNARIAWRYYLGDLAGTGDVPALAAAARAQSLAGLPAAYVATMELDPLRDEGIGYALALLRDGVSVELHSFPGTFHASAVVGPDAGISRRSNAELLLALGNALGVGPATGRSS